MIMRHLNEARVGDMSKEELKNFIKDFVSDEIDKDNNKSSKKEDIRKVVREMLKKHYRMLWTNSAFYLDKL